LARLWFHLPYFHACMNSKSGPGGIVYSSRRSDRRGGRETLEVSYNAQGPAFEAERGTLEYFLTERYCLYARKPDGELLRSEIHHVPWKLQEARATLMANTMLKNLQVAIAGPPVVLHYSKLQEMIAWAPKRIRV